MRSRRLQATLALYLPSLALTVLVGLSGCSNSPSTSPLDNLGLGVGGARTGFATASGFGSGTFYPLAVGNVWSYEGSGSLQILPETGPPVDYARYAFTETRSLIGTTRHEGTAYVVEEQVRREVPDRGPFTWYSRLRQSSEGLFALDTLLRDPPVLAAARIAALRTLRPDFSGRRGDTALLERLADRVGRLRELAHGIVRGGVDSRTAAGLELRVLVYPLRPGLTWSTRPDFPWPVTVDGVEQLETPAGRFAAYRLDIDPGGTSIQEGEWVRVWYSRDGYLGYSIHTFIHGTDEHGEPTGVTYVADDGMLVTSMQVAR